MFAALFGEPTDRIEVPACRKNLKAYASSTGGSLNGATGHNRRSAWLNAIGLAVSIGARMHRIRSLWMLSDQIERLAHEFEGQKSSEIELRLIENLRQHADAIKDNAAVSRLLAEPEPTSPKRH